MKAAPFSANGAAPRLIVVEGCSVCGNGAASANRCGVTSDGERGDGSYACVRGHFSDPETLRAVRAHLGSSTDTALILAGDVDDADVEPLLRGLSPFLGPKGVVLAACGRYDRDDLEVRSAVRLPLQAWLAENAHRLGFAPYLTAVGDLPAARDWVVLWHSPEAMDWSRQWMPIVADLGYDAESPRDHGDAQPDGSSKESKATPDGATESAVPERPMSPDLR
jgi:hypothetical protein